MTKDSALRMALEALENNKQTHYYCEDTWYSCPQHEDGCANDSAGDECNCGADKANAEIDKAITAIKEALAQPEQEPVAWMNDEMDCIFFDAERPEPFDFDFWKPLYTTPPQRTWVGLDDNEMTECIVSICNTDDGTGDTRDLIRAVEAKLKEKNT